MTNSILEFRSAIIEFGLEPPNEITPGIFHRFPGAGKHKSNRSGWCILFEDGLGGSFGDWSSGISQNWQANIKKTYTDCEMADFNQQVSHARAKAQEIREAKGEDAASRASDIWNSTTPLLTNHPYLKLKGLDDAFYCLSYGAIHSGDIARQLNEDIVLPIYNFDGYLTSLQFIKPDGSKRLLSGGRKHGCFIPVSGEERSPEQGVIFDNWARAPEQVIICEGWATGCTLAYKYPYATVIAAIDAGNLQSVALSAFEVWMNTTLIIAGDDDRETEGNPGATKARQAAIATGALVALPPWPWDAPKHLTDFNDLACWCSRCPF